MAAKKTTKKSAPKTATKTATVAKPTATPEEIFDYCAQQQERSGVVNKSAVAEHFGMTAQRLMMVVYDYCARVGEVPIRFATKGAAAPGVIKVRPQNKQTNSPVMTVGPSYLRAIGIEDGDCGAQFKVDFNAEDKTITLSLLDETDTEA